MQWLMRAVIINRKKQRKSLGNGRTQETPENKNKIFTKDRLIAETDWSGYSAEINYSHFFYSCSVTGNSISEEFD